jgi:hypothetical protein
MSLFYLHDVSDFLGVPMKLWLPTADWSTPVEIVHSFPSTVEQAISGKESRHFHSDNRAITTMRWQMLLAHDDAKRLLEALRINRTQHIAVPMIPEIITPATVNDRRYVATSYATWDDDGTHTMHASLADAAQSTRKHLAPLIIGYLISQPRIMAVTDGIATVACKIQHAHPTDDRIVTRGASTSNWQTSITPDWSEVVDTGMQDLVDLVPIGDREKYVRDGEYSVPARLHNWSLLLTTRLQLRILTALFTTNWRGRHRRFTIDTPFHPSEDTSAAVPATSIVRLADDSLTLVFETPEIVRTRLRFVELPWEQSSPDPADNPEGMYRTYLYKFTANVPGGPLVWTWVSGSLSVSWSGDVYTPNNIEHSQITATIDAADEPVEITAWADQDAAASTNPLLLVLRREIDVPIQVQITQRRHTAYRILYRGEIDGVQADGRKLTARTRFLGGLLENRVPRFLLTHNCNYRFCGPACGRDAATWTFTGTVIDIQPGAITLTITDNPTAAALSPEYFAKGRAWKGTGIDYEWRQIIRSDYAGGNVILTLKRPFRSLAINDTMQLKPHCSGTWQECRSKYNLTNEYLNFGGHRHIQDRNPSLPQLNLSTGGGGKK